MDWTRLRVLRAVGGQSAAPDLLTFLDSSVREVAQASDSSGIAMRGQSFPEARARTTRSWKAASAQGKLDVAPAGRVTLPRSRVRAMTRSMDNSDRWH